MSPILSTLHFKERRRETDVVDRGVCVRPQLFDGRTVPFDDDTFDLGVCAFVLHHAPMQRRLLLELARTCREVLVLEDTPQSALEWMWTRLHAASDWGSSCPSCFRTTPPSSRRRGINPCRLASDVPRLWFCSEGVDDPSMVGLSVCRSTVDLPGDPSRVPLASHSETEARPFLRRSRT